MEKIKTIWAYLCIQPDGNEGIFAQQMEDGWMPFVFSTEKLVKKVRPVAEALAEQRPDLKIKLVRFSFREEIESF